MKKLNKGAFKKTPEGIKTKKMIAVEIDLGRTLQEDYMDFYFNGEHGQRALAQRWGVKRTTIFQDEPEKSRTSWVTMLRLPRKIENTPSPVVKKGCEICNETPIEKAHWIDEAKRGGRQFYNIIDLCPTHHKKLEREHDEVTYTKAETILFYRSMKKLFLKHKHSEHEKREILRIAKEIIYKKL